MPKSEPTLFVATPIGGHSLHLAWASSMLRMQQAFPGRLNIHTQIGSLLPRNRDVLTFCFLQSPASHMLCVDSDIGFTPDDVNALLATGKDFVGGTYCKKQEDRAIPAGITGEHDDRGLFRAEWVPAGFLLLSRACVERMYGAYRKLDYDCAPWGRVCGLWSARPESPNSGEDVAFCRRWRDIGQDVWLHRGVVLGHWDGGQEYKPRPDSAITIANEDGTRETVGGAPPDKHRGHRLGADGWCRDCGAQTADALPGSDAVDKAAERLGLVVNERAEWVPKPRAWTPPPIAGAEVKFYGSLPVYIHSEAA